ncbi:GntR family transcriptional regulator [Streptomyces sp. NPDC097619]|uniref:GntR family transcriptional regulator n=1 Tax=Streptomyces sp. NPDC097619 TaxID=3157228 RepID=UPI00331E34D1
MPDPEPTFRPVVADGAHPPYVLVRDALSHAIAAGTLPAGARLPSERYLCRELAVSRVTLRRALKELQELGVIESSARRGWQVRTLAFSHAAGDSMVRGFTAVNHGLGRAVTARVLEARTRPARSEEAGLLEVPTRAALFELRRVRFLDGLPVCLTHDLVPLETVPDIQDADFGTASLFALLAAAGQAPVTARYRARAALSTPETEGPLELTPPAAVLHTVRTSLGAGGRPVAHTEEIYRADRYELRLTLG